MVKKSFFTISLIWFVFGTNLWALFDIDVRMLFETITELLGGICVSMLLWECFKSKLLKIIIIISLFILIWNFIEEAVLLIASDAGISYLQGVLWALSLSLTGYLLFKTNINYTKIAGIKKNCLF